MIYTFVIHCFSFLRSGGAIFDLQWGLSDNIQRQTITFPISFPKICYHITWTATSSAGNPYKTSGYVNSVTNISFFARADDTACQKYWFAVGV
ncbi:gp53-like domain-containing protein [Phascolarctobacterium succinatutens]|uniref:gp53-like domain-containing protein n=1 Tax=Phascolarctobacterium succinatutens TaxID=626940 RepID=UPI003F65C20E